MREDTRFDAIPNPLFSLTASLDAAARPKTFGSARVRLVSCLAGLSTVIFITIVGLWIEPTIGGSDFAVFFMLGVILSALRWGRESAVLTTAASWLSLAFFFSPAHRSPGAGEIWYLIACAGLLTVGLAIGMLTLTAREEASLARRREAATSALSSFTESLALGNELSPIVETVTTHFTKIFGAPMVMWLPDMNGLKVHFRSADLIVVEGESGAAAHVFKSRQRFAWKMEGCPNLQTLYWPLKAGGAVVGVIGFQTSADELVYPHGNEVMDIFMNQTALAITRAELARSARRAELLQETDKLQCALLNSVSHNLRSPLASVLGILSTILEDGPLLNSATQQSLLHAARDEAFRLDGLVRNLLDMTRLEGGAIRVKAECCDLQDVVTAAVRQLGTAATGRMISLQIPRDLPLVPMDDVLIVQVLVNLLDNALKYGPPAAPVELEARVEGPELSVRIRDRGWGIPEHELERIFEKFYRADSSEAPNGAGLGLSICKGFIEVHHGRILARRRQEGGTELSFFLPLREPRD